MNDARGPEELVAALGTESVRAIAERMDAPRPTLSQVLQLGRALAEACGDHEAARRLAFEVDGYEDDDDALPDERRVGAFASPFPVRALDLGLLDPEEVFLVNREKFSRVTLSIGQPVGELEAALDRLGDAGVLSLRVPASEVSGHSAEPEGEVYLYILPREIRRVLDAARDEALRALIDRVVEAARAR